MRRAARGLSQRSGADWPGACRASPGCRRQQAQTGRHVSECRAGSWKRRKTMRRRILGPNRRENIITHVIRRGKSPYLVEPALSEPPRSRSMVSGVAGMRRKVSTFSSRSAIAVSDRGLRTAGALPAMIGPLLLACTGAGEAGPEILSVGVPLGAEEAPNAGCDWECACPAWACTCACKSTGGAGGRSPGFGLGAAFCGGPIGVTMVLFAGEFSSLLPAGRFVGGDSQCSRSISDNSAPEILSSPSTL